MQFSRIWNSNLDKKIIVSFSSRYVDCEEYINVIFVPGLLEIDDLNKSHFSHYNFFYWKIFTTEKLTICTLIDENLYNVSVVIRVCYASDSRDI